MRKILLIIIGSKDLATKLSNIGIAHIRFDDIESYMQSIIRYIDHFITTDSDSIAQELESIKDIHIDIYYIGSTAIRFSQNIRVFIDINEPVLQYISNSYMYYTAKEIRCMQNIDMKNAQKYSLTVVLVGKIDRSVSLSKIKKLINSIRNKRLLNLLNSNIFLDIKVIYCGENKDIQYIKSYLRLDNVIELDINTKIDRFDSMCMHNLIDRSVYKNYWGALSQIPKVSDLCFVMDISRLDLSVMYIDLEQDIYDILEKMKTGEVIHMISDIAAIGTPGVMNYYAKMFYLYGEYKFKENTRQDTLDGIMDPAMYQASNNKLTLRSDAQLFEHIYLLSDLIITRMAPINSDSNIKKKKVHMILVTYYGIFDQFVFVKKALEDQGYVVHNYPYMEYINQGNDVPLKKMKELFEANNISYVLWWILNIDIQTLQKITRLSPKIKHLYFNWDEPYNWDMIDAKFKSKYISSAFVTCKSTAKKYVEAGALNAYCVYTGYSPELHYPMWLNTDIEYEFDISFVCTNLYEDQSKYPDQIVDRFSLINTIYSNQKTMGYKFGIFGPEHLKEKFGDSYQGFIKYDKTGNLFNRSKINICTHVVGNVEGYLNERVFLIMGSGGLLMVDPIKSDILINHKNCVFIDTKRILTQIKNILNNYDKYHAIKERAYKLAKNYTWDDWAMRIQESLLRDYRL